MTLRKPSMLILAVCIVVSCSSGEKLGDRAIIEKIADDIEAAVSTGDLMRIEKHLSVQAKREGLEANRFLMLSSYGSGVKTKLAGRSVSVMDDSAHLSFVLMPSEMQYSDTLATSVVRLIKTDTWEIVSFHLVKN